MPPEEPVSAAQVVLNGLADTGIDTVFGIPGVHTIELYRAIQQTPLRHVAVRHEQGAAFMADGFARVSGRPAACLLITGPGLMNAATAIGQAYSDSVPMVVLATVAARRDLALGRGGLHEMRDQRRAMESLVESAFAVLDPAQTGVIGDIIAARLATQRPRPAYIELPLDIATADCPPRPATRVRLARPGPDPAATAEALRLIAAAKRPFLLLGGGAAEAATEVHRLAAHLGAVVATSTAGKGIVPEDSPLSLGSTLGDDETRAVLAEADLALAVGTELSRTDRWVDGLPMPGDLVRIDLDPDVLARDFPPRLGILSDARLALAALLDGLAGTAERAPWRADIPDLRSAIDARRRQAQPRHCATLDALRAGLDDDGVVFVDMTQIAYAGNRYFRSAHMRCWHYPAGFGTLGYALPAAIGGKLAAPERQVVALAGDYGLGFTIQELATAAEQALSLPVVVWNNAMLGAIDDHMRSAEVARLAVHLRPPDFAAIAQAYGCAYRPVSEPAGLTPALKASFSEGRPTLIDVDATGTD